MPLCPILTLAAADPSPPNPDTFPTAPVPLRTTTGVVRVGNRRMDLHTFQPTFLIQIEGRALSTDLTGEITSFVFEDNEEELDVLELSVSDRHLRFVDDPLFQEGNEIVARFGYVNDLSPRKKAVIKDIDYDFPEDGAPSIRLKAYDKGFQLAGKENQKVWKKPAPGILFSEIAEEIAAAQKVWKKPAPGILFSEIAEEIAAAHGLTPVVTPTVGRHLRVVQSNVSDAQFLKDLAAKARDRDGDGVTGYTFFVEDEGLHFHPRRLETEPAIFLEYFTDRRSLLRSFRPSTQSQGAKGAGTQTKATGVDPHQVDDLYVLPDCVGGKAAGERRRQAIAFQLLRRPRSQQNDFPGHRGELQSEGHPSPSDQGRGVHLPADARPPPNRNSQTSNPTQIREGGRQPSRCVRPREDQRDRATP